VRRSSHFDSALCLDELHSRQVEQFLDIFTISSLVLILEAPSLCPSIQPRSSPSTSISGLLNTTLDSPISQSVLQLAKGNTSSNHLGRTTCFTGSNNSSSNSLQFASQIPCGLGSIKTIYKSRKPVILASMFHSFSQLTVSSRYASRCAVPRRRYGSARIAQRRLSLRIKLRRCCGRCVGR
jgi:hypothetical protein